LQLCQRLRPVGVDGATQSFKPVRTMHQQNCAMPTRFTSSHQIGIGTPSSAAAGDQRVAVQMAFTLVIAVCPSPPTAPWRHHPRQPRRQDQPCRAVTAKTVTSAKDRSASASAFSRKGSIFRMGSCCDTRGRHRQSRHVIRGLPHHEQHTPGARWTRHLGRTSAGGGIRRSCFDQSKNKHGCFPLCIAVTGAVNLGAVVEQILGHTDR